MSGAIRSRNAFLLFAGLWPLSHPYGRRPINGGQLRSTAMDTLYGEDAQKKIWSLIKDIKVAMMATWDPDSHEARSRPMMALKKDEFDGTLWFFTCKDSRKAGEVRDSHEALLTYAEPKDMNYVSISGRATLTDDRQKIDELWTDYAKVWFPEGKDDPNLVLLRFECERAE